MFTRKVHEQKMDLIRSQYRNLYLKQKCQNLEKECESLKERLIANQIDWAENSGTTIQLKKALRDEMGLVDQTEGSLSIVNDNIYSMFQVMEETVSSITENRLIEEDLKAVEELMKSLQDRLMNERLKEAEKEAQIHDLRAMKKELEVETEELLKLQPETISELQDQLIGRKLYQNQDLKIFSEIKTQLANINYLNEEMKKYTAVNEGTSSGFVKFSAKGVLWETTDKEKESILKEYNEDLHVLEEEKTALQALIPEYHNKIEIISKQIGFKEQESSKLRDKLTNLRIKEQSDASLIAERKRQCAYLEESSREKYTEIIYSSEVKDAEIVELSEKLEKMMDNAEVVVLPEISKVESDLENQILILEQKIKELEEDQH